jgi:hypothetical protein
VVQGQGEGQQEGAEPAAAAAEDEADEATSRQVELPAPEQLLDASSTALAAVKAAVQQDLSRTAASRTWWPYCFDTAAALQQQQQYQQQQAVSLQQQQRAVSLQQQQAVSLQQRQPGSQCHVSIIPSLALPWWSPGAGCSKLQRWFGVDLFVLLQPASYSRRFLDAAESSSLLSVARLALSSCGVAWPLLLPVHDALRDAYVGVAQVRALLWFGVPGEGFCVGRVLFAMY